MIQQFGDTKDPQAILDYSLDWLNWLNGDTISTSVWEVSSVAGDSYPLLITQTSRSGAKTTCWVSGGSIGNRYTLTNTITTAGGRTDQRTITLSIKNR